MTDDELFLRSRLQPTSARQAFLQEHAEDSGQFERVRQLLIADEAGDSLLDLPSTSDSPNSVSDVREEIGSYKLLHKIGEGGMGTVYMAEQTAPVKRVVALKVVKAGMDSKQVVARFEAERQSLALMDHPHIAKVLDAGSTERGEPYFVMELVRGIPINQYCDENRLSTEQRVTLMMDVCSAVQHAHQKGIIHRDLKPSNILVAQYDDRPVPKVIDFGVAKATHQKLTEKTLYTQLGQIVGTLEYMSPEQAVLNQLDVDTRTDVYSLGVILYELLVGETPLNGKELRSQGLEQILRTIREQEPARPSLRLSSQGDAATQTAAYRKTDQISLSRALRGDLDWIVMKALEKDRSRRYESASRLAEDLNNYLQGNTVEARPPTIAYRLTKSWRRNRVVVLSATAILSILSVSFVALWLTNHELRLAMQAWREELLERGIEAAFRGDNNTVAYVVSSDRTDQARLPNYWKLMLSGLADQFGGRTLQAQRHFEKALALEKESVAIKSALAMSMINRTIDQNRWTELIEELSVASIPTGPYEKYDRLLYGWSLVYVDPHQAAELLREAVDRPWPIGKAMLAQAVAHSALDHTDPEKAQSLATEALGHISDAEKRGSDIPFVISIGLFVRSVAIQELGHNSVDPTVVEQSASLIHDKPNLWQAANILSHYYALVADPHADQQFESCLKEDWAGACAIGYFFQNGKRIGSAELPSRIEVDQPYALVAATCIDVESAPEVAEERFQELKERFQSLYLRTYAVEILLHAGKVSAARREANQILEEINNDATPLADGSWACTRARLKLIAGKLTGLETETLLARSRIFAAYGQHILGLIARAEGKHREAEQHFLAVVNSGQFYIPQYYMARALLAEYGRDETPPEIDQKSIPSVTSENSSATPPHA